MSARGKVSYLGNGRLSYFFAASKFSLKVPPSSSPFPFLSHLPLPLPPLLPDKRGSPSSLPRTRGTHYSRRRRRPLHTPTVRPPSCWHCRGRRPQLGLWGLCDFRV